MKSVLRNKTVAAELNFVREVGSGPNLSPNNSVYNNLWDEYERVIVKSLITSFGLDFLMVTDREGGDVDTIHNVRKVGKEAETGGFFKHETMTYKNKENEADYQKQGAYNSTNYHKDPAYIETNKKYSQQLKEGTLVDGYTGKNNIDGKVNKLNVDHLVSAKENHDDRGRVLAGLDGTELANSSENLIPTTEHLNKSKGSSSMTDFLNSDRKAAQELTPEEKRRMMALDKKVRAIRERKIAVAYYTSYKFWRDTGTASLKVGVAMGARQVIGLVLTEVWLSIREEFRNSVTQDIKDLLTNIAAGVKKGIIKAKEKFGELITTFLTGSLSGIISSITTTLINIFSTTAKRLGKIIRESWSSLVEAFKILLLNPDNLMLGDRLKAAAKVIATGASVVAGTLAAEFISNVLPADGFLGGVLSAFSMTFVSGILSCTFLYFLDRSELIKKLVNFLNNFSFADMELAYYRRCAAALDQYAAELMSIDIDAFRKETAVFNQAVIDLEQAVSEDDLELYFRDSYCPVSPLPASGLAL